MGESLQIKQNYITLENISNCFSKLHMPCLLKHRQYYEVRSECPCIMPCNPPSATEALVTLLFLAHNPQSFLCVKLSPLSETQRSSYNLLEMYKASGVYYFAMICLWICHSSESRYVCHLVQFFPFQLWLAHFFSPALGQRTVLKSKKCAPTQRGENRFFTHFSSPFGLTLFLCVVLLFDLA